MADRFPLILNTSANQIQEIASGDTLDLSGNNVANAGIITATSFSGPIVAGAGVSNVTSGIGTFTDLRVGGDTSFSEDLVVTGNARITGILTVGTSSIILNDSANTIKVGTALTLGHTQGVQFHTQNLHSEGFEVNQINASGIITATQADINGDLDVDGHTNLDNVSISGVSTIAHTDFSNGIDVTGDVSTTGTFSINSNSPLINLNDNGQNPDYSIKNSDGTFKITSSDGGGTDKIKINTDGHIDITGNLDCESGVDVTGNVVASGNVTAVDGTFSGNVSIGATLTYEDVTNIDSVGIVTARQGIEIPNDTYKFRSGAQLEMQVWHDGTNSLIKDTRDSGKVRIQADNFDIIDKDASTTLFSAATGGVVTGDVDSTTGIFKRTTGFSSQLKFNGSNETQLIHASNGQVLLSFVGTGNAARGSIDGQSGFIRIKNAAGETGVICRDGSSTDLHYAGNKKLETQTNGVTVTGGAYFNTATSITGSPYKYLYGYAGNDAKGVTIEGSESGLELVSTASGDHASSILLRNVNDGFAFINDNDGNKLTIRQFTASSDNFNAHGNGNGVSALKTLADFNENGSVDLFHNNNIKFSTASDGLNLRGQANNIHVYLRTSDGTARGEVYANNSNQVGFLDETGNWVANFDRNTNCYLTGHWLPNANDTFDLGATGTRWRNLYVNDLQLSNESKKDGGGNDVDGTWGDYTIQEGESDLFLINNRSGKKYKFNLTEVS